MNTGKKLRELASSNKVVFVLGQSGSGKGTLVNKLKQAFKQARIAELSIFKRIFFWMFPQGIPDVYASDTGGLLRQEIPKMSKRVGELIGTIQSQGKLQSPAVAASLCTHKFLYEYQGGIVIVDGSPRTILEAGILVDFFQSFGKKIHVLNLQLDDEQALIRMKYRNEQSLKNGEAVRTDTDNDIKLRTKMQFYHDDVVGTLAHMVNNKSICVHNIDASKEAEEVFLQAIDVLLE